MRRSATLVGLCLITVGLAGGARLALADSAPLGAPYPAILPSTDLATKLSKPYLSDDWQPQIENLLGLALMINWPPKPMTTAANEMQPVNARVFRGTGDALMKSLRISESNNQVFSYSVTSGTEATVALALGSGGLNSSDLETVDVTTTLEARLDKAAGSYDAIATEIQKWLPPGKAALWVTGVNVYRIQHERYVARDKHAGISAGALSVGGKVYNKTSSKTVTSRLIPVGFIITKPGPITGAHHIDTSRKRIKIEDSRELLGRVKIRSPRGALGPNSY